MAEFWGKFTGHKTGVLGLVVVLLLLFAAVAAPVICGGSDPNQIGDDVMQPPSAEHLLGTDELGRDVLTGIIYGARISLMVGLSAAAAATLIGGLIGALAGFLGGWPDQLAMRVSEMFQVIPTFILAALIVALSGAGVGQVVAVIAILAWPQTARLMRAEVMRIKQADYVEAVRCLGIDETRILAREIVPNAMVPVLAVGSLIVGQAILLEAALGFFGLSSPDFVSWGRMLNSGQQFLFNAWWLSLFPGIAILVTVVAFNLVGDAVGIALDPRQGGRE